MAESIFRLCFLRHRTAPWDNLSGHSLSCSLCLQNTWTGMEWEGSVRPHSRPSNPALGRMAGHSW